MVQNVQYSNGPPSHVTLPFEPQTLILSSIQMVTVPILSTQVKSTLPPAPSNFDLYLKLPFYLILLRSVMFLNLNGYYFSFCFLNRLKTSQVFK